MKVDLFKYPNIFSEIHDLIFDHFSKMSKVIDEEKLGIYRHLNKITEVIEGQALQIITYFNKLTDVLSDKKLLTLFEKLNANEHEKSTAGFNIFNLISEKYYYENLHSDIISVFLNVEGQHKERDKFLNVFLCLLQRIKPELDLDSEDFTCTKISREMHHIDILIQDDRTGKAIIIENKINNASDTNRQLPTYVEKIGEENVSAIVYLPLDPKKRPDKTNCCKYPCCQNCKYPFHDV